MPRLEEIRGKCPHAIELLKRTLKGNRVSHAYMFYGEGSLKRDLALRFAQALLCRILEDDACGECSDCRRVAEETHPDLKVLRPDGAVFKISQVRELRGDVNLKPLESERRVFILEDCERMNLPAANAILKVLEEPPLWATMILVVSHPSALPPTVASRCQVLYAGEEARSEVSRDLLLRILGLRGATWGDLYKLSSELGELDRDEIIPILDALMDLILERGEYVELIDEISSIREGISDRFLNVQMAVDRILFRIKGEW